MTNAITTLPNHIQSGDFESWDGGQTWSRVTSLAAPITDVGITDSGNIAGAEGLIQDRGPSGQAPVTPAPTPAPSPITNFPAPPGYAWSIDPLTGNKILIDLTPFDKSQPIDGWHWIVNDPAKPLEGSWAYTPDPSSLEDPFEGVPKAIIPWLVYSLNQGGALDNIPAEAQAWVSYLQTRAGDPGRLRPGQVPFGLGLPGFQTPWSGMVPPSSSTPPTDIPIDPGGIVMPISPPPITDGGGGITDSGGGITDRGGGTTDTGGQRTDGFPVFSPPTLVPPNVPPTAPPPPIPPPISDIGGDVRPPGIADTGPITERLQSPPIVAPSPPPLFTLPPAPPNSPNLEGIAPLPSVITITPQGEMRIPSYVPAPVPPIALPPTYAPPESTSSSVDLLSDFYRTRRSG